MSDPAAAPPNRLIGWIRKAGYAVVLVVLTLILFGPAIPLDMALLLASAILLQIGFIAHPATRAGVFASVKRRASRLVALLLAP
jgi:hypothetical protein